MAKSWQEIYKEINQAKVDKKYKKPKPKNPTAKELEAEAIQRIRKGEGTLSDSLTAKIVPTDIQQAKIDAKPKKQKSVSQKIADIDNILNLELPENEIAKYESQRSVLVKELMKQYGGSQDSTSTDNYNAPEPKKKKSSWKQKQEDARFIKDRRDYWQTEGLAGLKGTLSKEEIKAIIGNDNARTWARQQAEEDLKNIKENERLADPLGLRK